MILLTPIVTEKSISNYQNNNKVTFEVKLDANKLQVKDAIEKAFDVEVLDVRVINRLGKYRENRVTRQFEKKRRDKKIAIATLADGSTIDIFNAGN